MLKSMLEIPLKFTLMMMIAALFMSGAYALTHERIEEQERLQAESMRLMVMPGAATFTAIQVQGAPENLLAAYQTEGGYVFEMEASGFNGSFLVMVGIDAQGTLTGVRIGSHAETPGLGSKMTDAAFYDQYTGKTAQTLRVVKTPSSGASDIQAITAATVTSRAVTDAVNDAIACFRALQ